LFGADYFGFSEKPNPTAQKKIAVYLKVIFVWSTGFCLLAFLFFSMSAQSNPQDSKRGNAQGKELSMVTDFTDLQWKSRVIIVDNVRNDGSVVALFEKNASEINNRDVIWFIFEGESTFTNSPNELSEGLLIYARKRYGSGQGKVVLIGKDGGIKSRSNRVDLNALFLKIDAMPMRQGEMRN
jgi:hypothetical protein